MNIPKPTLNGCIVWHMNHISIKSKDICIYPAQIVIICLTKKKIQTQNNYKLDPTLNSSVCWHLGSLCKENIPLYSAPLHSLP